MKQAQRKNFFREIRGSLNRWLSLLFISALGVAFFSGIRSSEPDMRLSADRLYDSTNYMDIRVLGTLGVTEEDLTSIQEVSGVLDAEGLYSLEALANDGEQELAVQVSSLPQRIGLPILIQGRMPETASECLLDVNFSASYPLGSTISLYEEATGDEDAEGTSLADSLERTEFTVTGYFSSATYLSWDRGTASIGDGSLDGLMLLLPEVFSSDYYTEIQLTVEGAQDLTAMTQEYEDTVTTVLNKIEAIADARCQIRYDSIVDEAIQELEDGRQKLADAKAEAIQELEYARKELEDAEAELADGRQTLEENAQELENGKADLEASRQTLEENARQLEDGKAQLEAGRQELEENAKQLEDGRAQLEAGRQELEASRQQLNDGWELYHQGEAALETGRQALEELAPQEEQMQAALAEINAQEAALAQGWEEYNAGLETYQENAVILENLKTQRDQLEALLISQELDPSQNEEYLTLAETIAQMETALAEAKETLDSSYETLSAGQAALDAAQETKQQLQDGLAQIDALRTQIQEGEAELAAQLLTLEEAQRQLEEGEAQLAATEATLQEGERQLAEGKAQLDANEAALQEAEQQLADGRQKLADAEATIQDGERQLADGRQELADAEQEIADGWAEYYDSEAEANQEIADAEAELADAEQEIADIEFPEWYVLDRNTVQNYVEYDMDAQRVGALAQVFPVIFFLVAALVSLTTMTRMVEDDRTQIGTLKALGYSKGSIAQKYILYALSATLFGSILGVVVGGKFLPWVILSAYGILYTTITDYVIPIQLDYSCISTAMAVVCTVGATIAACYRELAATPAQLMRPAAPKEGKRVFLERLPFLWKRLNFTSKSTVRNLIRYKKRFFMTVFGIGGCMGLLMVGFGLRDSVARIVDNQYATIWTYGATLNIDDTADLDALEEALSGYSEIQETLPVYQATKDASSGGTTEEVYLFVPEHLDTLSDFVKLRSRASDDTYILDDQGVIITEKLSRLMGLSVGDTFSLSNDETSSVEVTITAIAENYLYHYVYMTPALYQQLYGEEPAYNTMLLSVDSLDTSQEEALSSSLISQDGITSVTFIRDLQDTVDDMMRSLNLVIWVLIISAGLLAFVVLYNLNNINITERRRELATLKVLGFYDGEVAAYVYRENVLLTILGIIVGIFVGIGLHRYLIQTVELDYMMFGQTIRPLSYLFSILLTIVFSVVVNFFVFFKLRKIDMIESLKSVE